MAGKIPLYDCVGGDFFVHVEVGGLTRVTGRVGDSTRARIDLRLGCRRYFRVDSLRYVEMGLYVIYVSSV